MEINTNNKICFRDIRIHNTNGKYEFSIDFRKNSGLTNIHAITEKTDFFGFCLSISIQFYADRIHLDFSNSTKKISS